MTVTNNQSRPPSPQPWTGGFVGTSHHSLPFAMNLHEALSISGLILPTTPEWGSGHLSLSQTPQRIYVDTGSLETWALQQ